MLRQSRKITMTALSELIGVTPSYISLLEAGERQPSREIVLKIGRIFFSKEDAQALDDLLILAGLSPVNYSHHNQDQELLDYYEERIKDNDHFCLYAEMVRALVHNGLFESAEEKIYSGMKIFNQTHQLQTLMAGLQLCLKNYQAAVSSQESALLIFQNLPEKTSIKNTLELSHIYASMGQMFYLWGTENFEDHTKALFLKESNKESGLLEQSQSHLTKACHFYELALDLNPQSLYLHYEYAQTLLNLADLKKPDSEWVCKKSIDTLIHVVSDEKFQDMEKKTVKDCSALLAFAYTKSCDFRESRKLLGILQASYPDYWWIYYVKARHYALQAESDDANAEAWIEKAFKTLNKAISFKEQNTRVIELIPKDNNFQSLFDAHRERINHIISIGSQ